MLFAGPVWDPKLSEQYVGDCPMVAWTDTAQGESLEEALG